MAPGIMQQGLELMVYGMGTVIVFLGLLVLATTLMSRMVARYFPEAQHELISVPQSSPTHVSEDDRELLAVISAAVHRFRSRR